MADKHPSSQSYGFSSSHVWMWQLDHKEGWVMKNWHFWTVVVEKTPESPFDGKIKPVNPKEINSEYSLEGLILKLKLQYFGHLMWRTDLLEKTLILERLKAGGEEDDRGRNGLMASWTPWTSVWASSRTWWKKRKPGMLQSMGSQRVRHDWTTSIHDKIRRNLGIEENILNLFREIYYKTTVNIVTNEEELKRLLMKVKEESEKVGLKLNIQKTKIMASAPITSWQIHGETMETVTDYFLGLQNHCRWWLQLWN